MTNLIGSTTDQNIAGVLGENTNETDTAGPGVHGKSKAAGVWGESATWHGVVGFSQSTTGGAGLYGKALKDNIGAIGESTTGAGVQGMSQSGPGVFGTSDAAGAWGKSNTWHGVYGETPSTTGGAGVCGEHKGGGNGVAGISDTGVGVYGKGERLAGLFEGDVEVTGKIGGAHGSFNGDVNVTGTLTAKDILCRNADLAEDFDICSGEQVEPGTVMVLVEDGTLQPSQFEYDKRVAGVVSGAGGYQPALTMDKQQSEGRLPVALMGKVYCQVDADHAPVEIGDLLTTAALPGHAMKATDPSKAFGAVIGKALRPLRRGRGLIPILAALQ